jgi:endonuclease G
MSPPISYQELMEKSGIDFHLPIGSAAREAKPNNPSTRSNKAKVGGWYPVFFDDYSSAKVEQIIHHIEAGRVASIEIQYDRNSELAKKIQTQIESQTATKVTLMQSSPPDSATVTYERNRVTALIRSQ